MSAYKYEEYTGEIVDDILINKLSLREISKNRNIPYTTVCRIVHTYIKNQYSNIYGEIVKQLEWNSDHSASFKDD